MCPVHNYPLNPLGPGHKEAEDHGSEHVLNAGNGFLRELECSGTRILLEVFAVDCSLEQDGHKAERSTEGDYTVDLKAREGTLGLWAGHCWEGTLGLWVEWCWEGTLGLWVEWCWEGKLDLWAGQHWEDTRCLRAEQGIQEGRWGSMQQGDTDNLPLLGDILALPLTGGIPGVFRAAEEKRGCVPPDRCGFAHDRRGCWAKVPET